MKPITFVCEDTLGASPKEVAAKILDLDKWPKFEGYGIMPGIESAVFEIETPEVVGSKIHVTNTDGSTHIEEIVEWEPNSRICLRMEGFSPPVSRLATHFIEKWKFERGDDTTQVTRSFELHAKSIFTRPALWLISFLLKKAIARQLRQMRDESFQE